MQDNMEDQNVSVTVMVLILILVLLAGAVWYGSQHDMFGFVPTQNEAAKDEKPVEEEKKVEEVVESTEPTESTESSPSSPNVTLDVNNEISDDIKSALAEKFSKDESVIDVKVNEVLNDYAKGTVNFTDEHSGGIFLAIKTDNTWKLIFDGNGIVECITLNEYEYPAELMPQCWNKTSQILVNRLQSSSETK